MKALLLAVALAACATAAPQSDGTCNAAPAQRLVGQYLTAELGAEATRLAGARLGRLINPGQMVTMEFRQDRLNIYLDADGKIERLTCG